MRHDSAPKQGEPRPSREHPAGRGRTTTGSFDALQGLGAARSRKERPQAVLEVLSRSRVTPNLMRVRLGGEQVDRLVRNDFTDAYVKLMFPRPGSALEPPFDLAHLRAHAPEDLPALRTYTVRRWEADALAIDVVLHGHPRLDGIASSWADGALPGDRIAVRGSGGAYRPDPTATEHLLIGDHSALPAIARSLEEMPADARGRALLHVDQPEDRCELRAPDGIDVRWIDGPREALASAVAALPAIDASGVQVFAHGERGLVKQLRTELVRTRMVPRDRISISAYWALGRVEDEFQAEKRTDIGRIDP